MKSVIWYQLTPEQYQLYVGNETNEYYAKLIGVSSQNFVNRKYKRIFKSEELRKLCEDKNIEYPFLKPYRITDYFSSDDVAEIEMELENQNLTVKKLSKIIGISDCVIYDLINRKHGITSDITNKIFNYLYPDE